VPNKVLSNIELLLGLAASVINGCRN